MRRPALVCLVAGLALAGAGCAPDRHRPTFQACAPEDLAAEAGRSGAAAGTSFLDLRLRLVGGEPCFIRAWPRVEIVDAAGTVVDSSDPATRHDEAWILETDLDFHLGWASWCGPLPTGRLTAKLSFVEAGPTDLELPAGFGPSLCNGADPTLFVKPIEDQVIEPVR